MLGQPTYFLTPDVVGVHLAGRAARGRDRDRPRAARSPSCCASAKVVGKFVEFFGEGAATLPVPERATLSNMAPEYGATIGLLPARRAVGPLPRARPGARRSSWTRSAPTTGRRGCSGIPRRGEVRLHRRWSSSTSPRCGRRSPARSGRRTGSTLARARSRAFRELLARKDATGYGKPAEELARRWRYPPANGDRRPSPRRRPAGLRHRPGRRGARTRRTLTEYEMMNNRPTRGPARGARALPRAGRRASSSATATSLIAAITSCTNTSNPSVMLAAGLLARKAVARGLSREADVKTSLAPGSRVVTTLPRADRAAARPRRARLPDRRLRLHHLHRQLRPARRARREARSPTTTSSPPRCSRATATSRRASTRA